MLLAPPTRRCILYLALLLPFVALALLSGCGGGGDSGDSSSSSTSSSVSTSSTFTPLPRPIATFDSTPPGPAPSVEPTIDMPAALPTLQARGFAPLPTYTPSPTIDPSLPTPTPSPTYTPRPTSTPFPSALPLTNPAPDPHQQGVQYFPQTGHTLRGSFLDYWNKHGALSQFGYPITEEFMEADGPDNKSLQVQYFEKAKFEHHPEKAGGAGEVQVISRGSDLARQKGYFSGSYPRYGHAVDFSWISGQMTNHVLANCMRPDCGCSIVTCDNSVSGAAQIKSVSTVQLEGKIWRDYEEQTFISTGTFLVVFGHLAGPSEWGYRCGVPPETTTVYIYIVDSVHTITTP